MYDLFRIEDKVAVVTGAGSGIGRAIARGLALRGAAVVIVDIDANAAEDTATEIVGDQGTALALTADVRSPDGVDAMTEATMSHFGSIDILINNVGGNVGDNIEAERMDLAQWSHTLELTVTSGFLCAQAVGQHMISARRGKIINITSVYGLVAHDSSLYAVDSDERRPEFLAYVTAKGALVAFTRGLSAYWARHGITVNGVAPGMVRTPANAHQGKEFWRRLEGRIPLRRIAVPNDIVGSAVYLASPASDYMTGQILVVDGGWTTI